MLNETLTVISGSAQSQSYVTCLRAGSFLTAWVQQLLSVWANERNEYAYSSVVSFQNHACELLMSVICFFLPFKALYYMHFHTL